MRRLHGWYEGVLELAVSAAQAEQLPSALSVAGCRRLRWHLASSEPRSG